MTHPTTTAGLETTIDKYLKAWTEPDGECRARLVKEVWAADGQLIDPPLTAEGHAGISEMAAAMQAQFPGHEFRRVSGVDEHHGNFRFGWELVGPNGATTVTGIDVGEVTADGRLSRIVGFFGELPPDAA